MDSIQQAENDTIDLKQLIVCQWKPWPINFDRHFGHVLKLPLKENAYLFDLSSNRKFMIEDRTLCTSYTPAPPNQIWLENGETRALRRFDLGSGSFVEDIPIPENYEFWNASRMLNARDRFTTCSPGKGLGEFVAPYDLANQCLCQKVSFNPRHRVIAVEDMFCVSAPEIYNRVDFQLFDIETSENIKQDIDLTNKGRFILSGSLMDRYFYYTGKSHGNGCIDHLLLVDAKSLNYEIFDLPKSNKRSFFAITHDKDSIYILLKDGKKVILVIMNTTSHDYSWHPIDLPSQLFKKTIDDRPHLDLCAYRNHLLVRGHAINLSNFKTYPWFEELAKSTIDCFRMGEKGFFLAYYVDGDQHAIGTFDADRRIDTEQLKTIPGLSVDTIF